MAEGALIGREVEVAIALDAIGSGRSVILTGPPGIGKSSVARAVAAELRERGVPAVSVRASASGSGIPLGALTPVLAAAGSAAPDHARAALAWLRDRMLAADPQPVVVIDDAHELDDESAWVFEGLADAGVRLLATVRTPAAAQAWWTGDGFTRIELGQLGGPASIALAEAGLGGPLGVSTARMLSAAAAGNPLYLREIVNGGQASGALVERAGAWHWNGQVDATAGLTDLVQRRVEGLSATDREALELVALGEPVALAALESGAPDPEALLDSLAALERRSLIDMAAGDSGGSATVRVAHPVYGDVIRATMPVARRRLLCRRLTALPADPTPRAMVRAMLLRLDAGIEPTPTELIDAALAARNLDAFGLACKWFRLAAERDGGVKPAYLLGMTLFHHGDRDQAEAVLAEAAERAEGDDYIDVQVARAESLFVSGQIDAARAVLDEAEAHVPSGTDMVEAERALFALLSGEPATALAIAEPWLAGDGRSFAVAALPTAMALTLMGRTTEAIDVADRGVAVPFEEADEQHLTRMGLMMVGKVVALGERGDFDDAQTLGEIGYQAAVQLGSAFGEAWFAVVIGRIELARGRFATATGWFREGVARFIDARHPGQRWAWSGLALALAQAGDVAGATSALESMDRDAPSGWGLLDIELERCLAWLDVARGRPDAAHERLRSAAAETAGRSAFVLAIECFHDLALLGGMREDDLAAMTTIVEKTDSRTACARLAHAAALVAGEWKRVADSAGEMEELGMLASAADAYAQAATMALAAGDDRRTAATLATAARRCAADAGSETPALRALDKALDVSRREREIALLAVTGLPNRDIGERLYLSTRTVENHLNRLYRKLGVSSRAELADASPVWDR